MELSTFFHEHPKLALAFSGGVDSAYLLYVAIKHAADVQAYYIRSAFQAKFEWDDAEKMAKQLNTNIRIIEVDVLSFPEIASNPADRCYHCKKRIFSALISRARSDGYRTVMDGTNASDDANERPGMRALQEMSIFSPLRDCGLTKHEIRLRSQEAGLFTWDKAAYSCLATRIAGGECITREKLENTEAAETFLFSLGFSNFRVRRLADSARIQLPVSQMEDLIKNRDFIVSELKKYYRWIWLDLEARNE